MYFPDSDPHRELDDLGFERLQPSPWLRGVIQCYWGARARLTAPRAENLYPDGGWGLAFSFGDPPLPALGAFPPAVGAFPGGTLEGVTTDRRELALAGSVDLFGVRFHPGAASFLIGVPSSEMRDRVAPLEDAGCVLPGLQDRLSEVGSTVERARLFEKYLGRRITLPSAGLVEHARDLVQQSGGMVRIEEVAARLGVSQRKLERAFRSRVGLPPKTLARLTRIRRARLAVKLARDRQLVDIALESGYFTRDFREVVGMSPGRYRHRAAQRGSKVPQ